MKENVNEQRHQIQQCIRETEQIKASTVQHRQQIAKVISEDRLQQLLQLDEEQLKTLTFAQIKGTERRWVIIYIFLWNSLHLSIFWFHFTVAAIVVNMMLHQCIRPTLRLHRHSSQLIHVNPVDHGKLPFNVTFFKRYVLFQSII